MVYKYQLIQALDDKIGPDLRRLVEGYLGPDRERTKIRHRASWLAIRHFCFPIKWCPMASVSAQASL